MRPPPIKFYEESKKVSYALLVWYNYEWRPSYPILGKLPPPLYEVIE